MTAMLRILCRVIARRLEAGEAWEGIINDYPRLTAEEIGIIKKECNNNGESMY